MTGYDAQKGDILASVDAVYMQGVTDGQAAQQATDAPTIAALNATISTLQANDTLDEQTIADLKAQVAKLQAELDDQDPPVDPPPPAGAVFSAYAGPLTTSDAGQTPAARARLAKALGVPVLPIDRVYSAQSFGKAATCPSPLAAVSYGQVPALAKGDAATIKSLTAELAALAKTGRKYDVSCDHEVDSKIRAGTYTGADVKKAHAAFAKLVRSIGSANLRVVGCWTGYVFTLATSDPSHPDNYYDPASYDAVALDPYWPTQKTAAIAFDPGWKWASSKGKPVLVWETGWSTDSNPQSPTDAQVTTKVAAIIDYWKPKAEYVLFFESVKGNNLLETRPAALKLWAAATQGN